MPALYLVVLTGKSGGQKYRLLCGVMSVAAFILVYLVRPMLTVVWIALALIQFFLCVKNRKIFPMIGIIIMLFAGILVQKQVLNYVGETADVVVDNGMPKVLWIAMGMQGWDRFGHGIGAYNAYSWDTFVESGYDKEEAARRGWENISETLHLWLENPRVMCGHFFLKTVNQWTEPSYGAFSMTCSIEDPEGLVEDLYYGRLHEIIYEMLDCFQTLCFFLLAAYFWYLFKRVKKELDKMSPQEYLIVLILMGGFFSVFFGKRAAGIFFLIWLLPSPAWREVLFIYTVRRQKPGMLKNPGHRMSRFKALHVWSRKGIQIWNTALAQTGRNAYNGNVGRGKCKRSREWLRAFHNRILIIESTL